MSLKEMNRETCLYFEPTSKNRCGVEEKRDCRGQILLCPNPRKFDFKPDGSGEEEGSITTEASDNEGST